LVQNSTFTTVFIGSPTRTDYWALQDANYNVLGIIDSSGVLTERYQYTPYGQRKVFFSDGANDVGCYAPTLAGRRRVSDTQADGAPTAYDAWAINDVGHQGLLHDEELGLVYNRARDLAPEISRFMQRDPRQELQAWRRIQVGKRLLTVGVIISFSPVHAEGENHIGANLKFLDDDRDLYVCQRNRPIDRLDPSGEQSFADWLTCVSGQFQMNPGAAAACMTACQSCIDFPHPLNPGCTVCTACMLGLGIRCGVPPLPTWPPPTSTPCVRICHCAQYDLDHPNNPPIGTWDLTYIHCQESCVANSDSARGIVCSCN
jgi:RHS repeat-associated protein